MKRLNVLKEVCTSRSALTIRHRGDLLEITITKKIKGDKIKATFVSPAFDFGENEAYLDDVMEKAWFFFKQQCERKNFTSLV